MSFEAPRILAPPPPSRSTAGFALVFFYAPNDADQGFIQKIFYLHVPLATCALVGFIVAAVQAIRHLRTGDSVHDVRSYVSIHISVIFGVAVLLTGAIWAKASWGKWWVWDEPTLVSFLIVFLLYCTYYPLRYAIEDRERQARYASVFAITAGAFVPLNFIAVRLAETLVHPRVFATAEGGLPPKMWLTFLVCLAGHGAAVGDAGALRAGRQVVAGADLGRLRRALDGDEASRRCGLADRAAVPREARVRAADARAAARRGRQVRRRRLRRLPRPAADLRRDHGRPPAARSDRELGRARRARPRGALRWLSCSRLGVSHKTAPLELRERLALTEGRAVGVLGELVDRDEVLEAAAISTCNRTELYLFAADAGRAPSRWRSALLAREAEIRPTELVGHLYSLRGVDAAEHLLPGHRRPRLDDHRRGRDPGPGQARLRARAGRGRDRARSSTASSAARSPPASAPAPRPGSPSGALSIPSVAVELAQRTLGDLDEPPGAGRRRRRDGRADRAGARGPRRRGGLHRQPPLRPRDRARRSASAASAVRFEELPEQMVDADIVVSSTNSPHHVIEREELAEVMARARRTGRCC